MTILNVEFSQDKVIFINPKTEKAETVLFEEAMEDKEAMRLVRTDVKARGNTSRAALSLMVHILDTPRLDGYKGGTPHHERIPAEFKSALREVEDAYLRPRFDDGLAKNLSEGQRQKEWDIFIKGLREPGVYAMVRSTCVKYFAHMGMLPCAYTNGNDEQKHADKHKLMAVSAMTKLLSNEKERAPGNPVDASIPAKIGEQLARMLETKDELSVEQLQTIIGRCEHMAREARELVNTKNTAATTVHQDNPDVVKAGSKPELLIGNVTGKPLKTPSKAKVKETATA